MPAEPTEHEFLALLPWYQNGTLAAAQVAQVEHELVGSVQARRQLERERLIVAALPAMLAPAPADVGLAALRQRLVQQVSQQVSQQGARQASWRANWLGWWRRLATPALAGGLAVACAAQFAVLAVVLHERSESLDAYRHVPVQELRTLRVKFKATVPELQLREALVAAGARIVGGPNQFGEYWIASSMVSIDEMRHSLELSGVAESMVPDTEGPR